MRIQKHSVGAMHFVSATYQNAVDRFGLLIDPTLNVAKRILREPYWTGRDEKMCASLSLNTDLRFRNIPSSIAFPELEREQISAMF